MHPGYVAAVAFSKEEARFSGAIFLPRKFRNLHTTAGRGGGGKRGKGRRVGRWGEAREGGEGGEGWERRGSAGSGGRGGRVKQRSSSGPCS